jgi:SAM-dependent methyltransferase
VLHALLPGLISGQQLETAIDVACGLGYFSRFLKGFGLQVTAIDGRQENVEEAAQRSPGIAFHRYDVEDSGITSLGEFDLVFCFGLLYHLENPLHAIRLLKQLTRKTLLVESVIHPGEEPIMALIDEASTEDQGLNHFAFYPTEACLVKMLYRAGFSNVYGFAVQPEHPGYHNAPGWRRSRTMLAASNEKLDAPQLVLASEPRSAISPWDSASGVEGSQSMNKLLRFAGRPMNQKVEIIKRVIKGK